MGMEGNEFLREWGGIKEGTGIEGNKFLREWIREGKDLVAIDVGKA